MKRNVIAAGLLAALCVLAYLSGRAYQQPAVLNDVRPATLSAPTIAPVVAPANFGRVIYANLAGLSFAELYETMRGAPSQSCAEWLREIEQIPEGSRKIAALCGFFRALVQTNPRIAADLVIQLPRHRGPAMDAMISAAPPSAMPVLAEMLLNVPTAARNFGLADHFGIVLDEWAQIDPDAVAQFFEKHQEVQSQENRDSLVRTWAGIDHEAAWKWLEAHSDDSSPYTIPSWLSAWFSGDPHGAIGFAFAHVKDEKFADAITGLAPELFEQNQSSAKAFMERLPTAEMRQAALGNIAERNRYSDEHSPADVANFVVQFPPSEWPRDFSKLFDTWRSRKVAELLDWTSRLPPEIQTPVIENFPPPDSDEPERDFLPLLQMPESNLRAGLLRQLVKGLESENQSAREAVAKLNLTPEQKAELAVFVPENGKP